MFAPMMSTILANLFLKIHYFTISINLLGSAIAIFMAYFLALDALSFIWAN
jgi:hypothetical protein